MHLQINRCNFRLIDVLLPLIVEVLWVSPKAILVLAPKSANLTVPVSTKTLPPLMSLICCITLYRIRDISRC